MKNERIKLFVAALFIAVVAFVESYIPYCIADRDKPPQSKFLGQLAYTHDHDMYFSFIRQAYDGKLIFNNRLTAIPNSDVFFNIEFLIVGQAMRFFHVSENGVYQLWRFAGVCSLTFGFAFLTLIVLPNFLKRSLALCVFIFAGGFGIFFAVARALGYISREVMNNFSLDLLAGVLPLQQLMLNPHFSLPHGLMLIGFATFLLAEKDYSPHWYIASGTVFFLNGFIRPYDLISLFVGIGAFIGIEAIRHFDRRTILLRAIPLAIISPVLVYSIWLFRLHPVFKYWSRQGHNISVWPPPYIGIFAYGVIAILAIYRILQLKKNPLSSAERFLCIWFVSIFCLSYIGTMIPRFGFSPQLGIPLFGPLVVLAFSLRLQLQDRSRTLFISLVALLVIIGNIGIVAYHSQRSITAFGPFPIYATDDEIAALEWLNKTVPEENAVLALPPVSGRICKYTSASSVVGHFSLTPNYPSIMARVRSVLTAPKFTHTELSALRELGTDFLFIGPEEQHLLGFDPNTAPHLSKVYAQGSVAIYKVDRLAK